MNFCIKFWLAILPYILQVKIFLYGIVEEKEVSLVNLPEFQYLPPGEPREIFPHQVMRHPVPLGEILVNAGDSDQRKDDVWRESKSLNLK